MNKQRVEHRRPPMQLLRFARVCGAWCCRLGQKVRQVRFDRDKMRAVILRACYACGPDQLGATKLHKVLYFLDMISYAHRGEAVTGATYRKRPFGPTADQLLSLLRDMQTSGDIEIRENNYHGFLKREFLPLVVEPDNVLSNEDSAILDDVIEFVCKMNTAKGISEYSHQAPWEMAEFGDVISYPTSLLLFPSDPLPKAFEIARRGFEELGQEGSGEGALGYTAVADFRGRLLEAARGLRP